MTIVQVLELFKKALELNKLAQAKQFKNERFLFEWNPHNGELTLLSPDCDSKSCMSLFADTYNDNKNSAYLRIDQYQTQSWLLS